MGLSDNRTHRNGVLNFMIFMLVICVILLIVGCCGMSTLATTLQGASWATTVSGDGTVFTSFYGLCSNPANFLFPDLNNTNTGIKCKDWKDILECRDIPDEFYRVACRTKGLKHWLGFCMITSFFLTLIFTIFVIFRRVVDSPKRKKGAVITGWLAWLFLILTFATFSVNCIPRGAEYKLRDEKLWLIPGPGMGSTIAVWFFLFIFVPVNMILAPHGASPRARYQPRETPHVSGMP
eukprot:scaffold189869_cov32-Tisochrysis_lutea.AAC.1